MAAGEGSGIEVRILGPLELVQQGEKLPLGGAKERALLVRLAIEAGREVSTDRLIEDLWEGGPPDRALDTLRVYVSHLRKSLPAHSIETKHHGYALTVEDIDVARFAALAARARAEEPKVASRTLREALSLWRGPALADVADATWARGRAGQLEEERLAALEARVGADLARGAHAELIGELEMLTAAHPLRERFWELRIVALYRAGRQADALGAYRELRRALSEELGVDPSPDLQALERKVLEHDPSLSAPGRRADRELGGAVTFLFSDIEGSTRLWNEHPGEMEDAVRAHDEILRASIERHGGLVFKHTGDGVCAAFGAPPEALAAALEAQIGLESQSWGDLGRLRVRIAVHSGSATRRDGDFFGPALNRCARLLDAGHGGQVLVSEASAHLLADELPDGATLVDLGAHRLRDLGTPQRIFRLAHDELAAEFPPLRTLDEHATNLPVEASTFVGRERELAHVAEAIAESPIVTLTGVGGVGKTRLALRAAAEAMHAYRDGVWLCELAPVASEATVEEAISGAVRVPHRLEGRTGDALVAFLRERELLLILDNCEHVLGAAASVAEQIAGSCPGVRILATSREGLAVTGERMIAVPSLTAPDAGAGGEAIRAADASRLFLERARAANDAFALTPENAGAVAEICRRLDGIPLALELAAARLRVMTAEEIARRLDQRFRLLTGGRRTASERHQTLRRTIDWSYDLLDDGQRLALDRLAVFAGGFTLDAAEAVIAGEGIGAGEVVDLVIGLVERSLVVSEQETGPGRYGMLETVRQYAEERLAERAEITRLRRRHALHFVEFVERTAPLFAGPQEPAAVAAVDREVDNLRSAAEWCIEQGETELAMRLTAPLWWEKITERTGRAVGSWAERVIAMDRAEEDPRFELACATSVMAAWNRGDAVTARSLAEKAVAVPASRGRRPHLLTSHVISFVRHFDADPERLRRAVDEYLVRIESGEGADDPDLIAYMLASAAGARFALKDPSAIELGERAVRLAREAGSPSTLVYALFLYAVTHGLFEGREEFGVPALEEAVAVRGVTRRFWQRLSEAQLARVRAAGGDVISGLRLLRKLLVEAYRSGDQGEYLMYVVNVSGPLALAGDDESSVLAEEVLAARGYPVIRAVADRKFLDEAREHMGEDAVRAVAARAATMSMNELNDSLVSSIDRLLAAHEPAGDG
ncbi:MAG: BTAD domain-containing putative transcriptional regulator [Actinomycetota bacterium]